MKESSLRPHGGMFGRIEPDAVCLPAILPTVNLTEIAAVLERDATPLIRTDRSNDAAWSHILEALAAPVDTVGTGDPHDFVAPNVSPLDGPGYEGVTGDALGAAIQAAGNVPIG